MNFDLVEVGMFQGYVEFGWGSGGDSAPNQYPNIQSALKVAVDFGGQGVAGRALVST